MKFYACLVIASVLGFGMITASDARNRNLPNKIEVYQWSPPFNNSRQYSLTNYTPIDKLSQKWSICLSIPHLKDDYWLAVNFGAIEEARRLGFGLNIFEAGGYQNLKTQKEQIRECVAKGNAKGVIIGAISADDLGDILSELNAKQIPVIDLINGINSTQITARVAVDFYDMGKAAAMYLRNFQSQSGKAAKIAWFPGPQGAGWVTTGDKGFKDGLQGSQLSVVETRFGDTGIAEQAKLINEVLKTNRDLDFIAGTAVSVEAAVTALREHKLADKVKVISYYFGSTTYKLLQRGNLLAAPTDQPAAQARLALNLMGKILEKKEFPRHISARIELVDFNSVKVFDTSGSLAPAGFRPIFSTTN